MSVMAKEEVLHALAIAGDLLALHGEKDDAATMPRVIEAVAEAFALKARIEAAPVALYDPESGRASVIDHTPQRLELVRVALLVVET